MVARRWGWGWGWDADVVAASPKGRGDTRIGTDADADVVASWSSCAAAVGDGRERCGRSCAAGFVEEDRARERRGGGLAHIAHPKVQDHDR